MSLRLLRHALVAASLVVPALACDKGTTPPVQEGDDEVDRMAKQLWNELELGNHAELVEMFPSDVAASLDERDTVVIARTLTWLGTWSEFTRSAEQPVVGGVERRYAITLERGEAE